MAQLTLEQLRDAVGGDAIGLRARIDLEPLGGPDDKVFPPTYSVPDNAESRYATEERRVGGETVKAVVLDSVASQANRMELALLEAHRLGELTLPMVSVDFRKEEGIFGLDRISHLEASHRIFDAALRDSLYEGKLFRLSDPGIAITEATPRNAAALFHYSPTTLLFGGWDSTGPRGGLGAKYERAITSEIVALNVELGRKTASRIDVLGIENVATLYRTPDYSWTLDPEEAAKDDKGKPDLLGKGTDRGRPSQANLGNVTPSIDVRGGGVTADEIRAQVVLSFAGLRKLRFPTLADGTQVPAERRRDTDAAAWTALAALGVAATVLAVQEGFDLRSRCVLVSRGPIRFELLPRDGSAIVEVDVGRQGVLELVEECKAQAAEHGLTWQDEELLLTPAPRLVRLIQLSQDQSRQETGG